jgi:hypothetical protein
VQLLTNLLAHAWRHQRPIFFVLVDIVKAYPSTPFVAFLQALEDLGCPPDFVALHNTLQSGFTCAIRSPFGHSLSYPINNRCKEGCGASPRKYISYMDMFFRWLNSVNLGYHFTLPDGFELEWPSRELIVASAGYVNDTGLFAGSSEDCQAQIDMLTTFLEVYGQRLNPAKCTFVYWVPDGHHPPAPPMALLNGTQVPLPMIDLQTPFRYLGYWYSMDGRHHQEEQLGLAIFPLLHQLGCKWAPFLAKSRIVNANVFSKITFAANVVDYSKSWISQVQTATTKAVLHPTASALVSHRVLTRPADEIGFSIVDLWAACCARLIHGLNAFLNGLDTECTTTTAATLFSLQQVLYSEQGAWRGPPPRSNTWDAFPCSWRTIGTTAHAHDIEVLPRDARPDWAALPIQRLFSLAGMKQAKTYPLLSTLRAQGITTVDQISRWCRLSPPFAHTPLEDALLLQQRVGPTEFDIVPASEPGALLGLHSSTRARVDRLLREAISAITATTLPLRLTNRADYWRTYLSTHETRTDRTNNVAASDGSYDRSSNTGGAAVVTERGTIARATVQPCLSSTHAELVAAALGACFVTNADTTTHIDSTAAIHCIVNDQGTQGKHRDIVKAIRWLTADRRPAYEHVRAHTNNLDLPSRLNRTADREAKVAARGRPSVSAPNFTHFLDRFIFRISGAVCQSKIFATTLRHLTSSRPIPPDSRSGHMLTRTDAWREPSTFALRNGNTATRTFAWKLITRTLPTLEALHTRRPDIYNSDRCPTCPTQVETGTHIFLHCPSHRAERDQLADRLVTTLRHHDPDGNASPWLTHSNNVLTLTWDPDPIAAALVPITLQHQLAHLNDTHAAEVARKTNQIFVNAYKAIWASRCETIRQHGLTWGQLTGRPDPHPQHS